MGELNIMDGSGHVSCKWDPSNNESITLARETYDQCIKKGARAFLLNDDGGEGEMIEDFDPSAGTILLVPPLRGG